MIEVRWQHLKMKAIGIFASSVHGVALWDPDHIQSGIAGSEEAVIYLSQALAKLGNRVIVLGDSPAQSKHLAIQTLVRKKLCFFPFYKDFWQRHR